MQMHPRSEATDLYCVGPQDGQPTALLDLPDENLIAIFAALEDPRACRQILPLVCARIRDLLRQPSAVWQVREALAHAPCLPLKSRRLSLARPPALMHAALYDTHMLP